MNHVWVSYVSWTKDVWSVDKLTGYMVKKNIVLGESSDSRIEDLAKLRDKGIRPGEIQRGSETDMMYDVSDVRCDPVVLQRHGLTRKNRQAVRHGGVRSLEE